MVAEQRSCALLGPDKEVLARLLLLTSNEEDSVWCAAFKIQLTF